MDLDNLEKRVLICERIFTGHTHRKLDKETIFLIMKEMEESFINAYHSGIPEEKLLPLEKRYHNVTDFYLKYT